MEMNDKTINPERDCKLVSKKPPLPPRNKSLAAAVDKSHLQWKTDDEQQQQLHRLTALNEKLRIDVVDLRKQLTSEGLLCEN